MTTVTEEGFVCFSPGGADRLPGGEEWPTLSGLDHDLPDRMSSLAARDEIVRSYWDLATSAGRHHGRPVLAYVLVAPPDSGARTRACPPGFHWVGWDLGERVWDWAGYSVIECEVRQHHAFAYLRERLNTFGLFEDEQDAVSVLRLRERLLAAGDPTLERHFDQGHPQLVRIALLEAHYLAWLEAHARAD